jgi:hypothetical protein
VTIIPILLCASASAGLSIGLVLFRAEAIMLASPLVALFAALLLRHQNFGLLRDVLIVVGSLTALQGSYLVGAFMRYLAMAEASGDRTASGAPASTQSATIGRSENRSVAGERSSLGQSSS